MGYEVIFINNNEDMLGHSSVNSEVKLMNTMVTQDVYDISTFDFTIAPNNPAYSFIEPNKTIVQIFDAETEFLEFEGRVADVSKSLNNNVVEHRYQSEDRLGLLRDSVQSERKFRGKPSDLFKLIVNRHNEMMADDPWKQFGIGEFELDEYVTYVSESDVEDERVNVVLKAGDNATIRNSATYIYASWNGEALIVANYIKGVTLTVDSRQEVGGEMRYLLYRVVNGVRINEGIVSAKDIVETYTTSGGGATTRSIMPLSEGGNRQPWGTKATIRPGITLYYWSADGTGPTTIPQEYRTKNYIVQEYSSYYDRYAIYTDGYLVAWIDASALDFGTPPAPTKPIVPPTPRPTYTRRVRTISADLTYDINSYDAIKRFLLEPYNAEMVWEKIEEVPTLHIRRRIENETDEEILVGLNLISLSLDTNTQDIYSGLIPVGSPPKEDEEVEHLVEEEIVEPTGKTHSSNAYLNEQQRFDNASHIWKEMKKKGWSDNAVAGLLGNTEAESGHNPGIWQGLHEGDLSRGYGLVQYTPASLWWDYCDLHDLEPSDIDNQLAAIDGDVLGHYYATDNYNLSYSQFKTSTQSPTYLANAFMNNFERPANRDQPERGRAAERWKAVFG